MKKVLGTVIFEFTCQEIVDLGLEGIAHSRKILPEPQCFISIEWGCVNWSNDDQRGVASFSIIQESEEHE